MVGGYMGMRGIMGGWEERHTMGIRGANLKQL